MAPKTVHGKDEINDPRELHKLQEGSKEKGIAMTTGFNVLRLCVNFANNGLLFALGRLRQRAVRCRKQALFLYSLTAIRIFFCHCKANVELLTVSQSRDFSCFAGVALTKTRLFLFNQRLFETLFRLVAQGESATLTR